MHGSSCSSLRAFSTLTIIIVCGYLVQWKPQGSALRVLWSVLAVVQQVVLLQVQEEVLLLVQRAVLLPVQQAVLLQAQLEVLLQPQPAVLLQPHQKVLLQAQQTLNTHWANCLLDYCSVLWCYSCSEECQVLLHCVHITSGCNLTWFIMIFTFVTQCMLAEKVKKYCNFGLYLDNFFNEQLL